MALKTCAQVTFLRGTFANLVMLYVCGCGIHTDLEIWLQSTRTGQRHISIMINDREKIDAVSEQLCFAAYSLSHSFNRQYRIALEGTGLTYPQYLVVVSLTNLENPTIIELGKTVRLDYGTLTPMLKRLERDGIISRSRTEKDERIVRIALSAKGRELVERLKAVMKDMKCLTGKSSAELSTIVQELNVIRSRLDASAESSGGQPS
jgi:DNA-binding MarR family transcriptional regulator